MIHAHFSPLFAEDPPPPPPTMAIPVIFLVIMMIDTKGDGVVLIMAGDVRAKAEIEAVDIEDDDEKDALELDDLVGPDVFLAVLPIVSLKPVYRDSRFGGCFTSSF